MSYTYEEIISHIQMESVPLYLPAEQPNETWKKMLVILPNLSCNGAMAVMMELLPILREQGFFLYILASEDGEFREQLIKSGAVVFIRPYVKCENSYRLFLQEAFDVVFINTAGCFYYAYYFMNQPIKVLWWLHETKEQLDTFQKEFLNFSLLSDNFILLGVTKLVVQDIRDRYCLEIEDMPMPIADCGSYSKRMADERVTFFMPAAYTYIKGQDILLQAITMLPPESLQKAEFVFCGYRLEGQQKFYELIKKIAEIIPEVIFLDRLERDEVYEWYEKCDCVIAPSRVDATPTTVVEAMMHRKLCIVSDAAGISAYMQDCVNGLIFPSENAEELCKRLLLVIEEREGLDKIAEAGRKIYETFFSVENVAAKLSKIMEN